MNLTQTSLSFLLLTVNSAFTCELPRIKTQSLDIPVKSSKEELESRSLDAGSSGTSTVPTSSETSPKSGSPSRRSWDCWENAKQAFIDSLPPLKKFKDPQTEKKFSEIVQKKLVELAHSLESELEEIERIETTKNEERLVMKNVFYDYPGSAAKFCSLEEHQEADINAWDKYQSLLEGQ
jgi:hypothetical protein